MLWIREDELIASLLGCCTDLGKVQYALQRVPVMEPCQVGRQSRPDSYRSSAMEYTDACEFLSRQSSSNASGVKRPVAHLYIFLPQMAAAVKVLPPTALQLAVFPVLRPALKLTATRTNNLDEVG